MSTQQQIDQWNAALRQKQEERAAQQTILRVQQEELAKAENATVDAELALDRARKSGASAEQVESLQRQVKQASQAESSARVAASQTEDNISSLDGSIRYNTTQRDLYQGSLPAQGNPSSTVADQADNARSDAEQVAPAPQPVQTTPAASAIEQGGEEEARIEPRRSPPEDFVYEEDGTLIPADSSRAEERRAEIAAEEARGRTDAPAPVADSTQAEGDAGEAEAQAALQGPDPVPPNLTTAWDPETGSYGVWDEDKGEFIETGLSAEEAERAAGDPFEAARLAREAEEELPNAFGPEPVPPSYSAIWDSESGSWGIWEDPPGAFKETGYATQEEADRAILNIAPDISDEDLPPPPDDGLTDEERAQQAEAAAQAAAKENAINQATRNSVYKQGGSTDWRVRLQLAPTSNYLYNAGNSGTLDGSAAGILAPLTATNGVIFPYTPQIQTNYQAKYADYDLVHSNFRGVFYQSSRVDDINIRAEFTAQDTNEANYLLAVIHFFRSVTKMFYGKDTERGTPPPLVYLSGLGMNQFYGHPCLVRSFQYALPNNVDYIRATSVNNYGTDLLNRRNAGSPSSTAGLGPTGNRILNAGLEKFFPASKPVSDAVVASVNNTQLANYVPTKMEIDIVLIPVQTRSQVSKQFSLKGFANGDLIKGGFW